MTEVIDAEATVVQQEDAQENATLELIITKEVPGILEWDFESLNRGLDFELQKFKNASVTKENLTNAKKVRSDLNNLSKTINNKKIQVKNKFTAPYIEFESKVKVLLNKIKETTDNIDQGIKTIEEAEKNEKKKQIMDYFTDYCSMFDDSFIKAFPFSLVFNEKWLNKTCKVAQWTKELEEACMSYYNNYQSFSAMFQDDEDKVIELKGIFLTSGNFDIAQTLSIQAKMEELRKAKELQATKQNVAESPKEVPNISSIPQPVNQDVPMPKPQPVESNEDKIFTLSFTVQGTKAQLNELANYMNQHRIKFQQINN